MFRAFPLPFRRFLIQGFVDSGLPSWIPFCSRADLQFRRTICVPGTATPITMNLFRKGYGIPRPMYPFLKIKRKKVRSVACIVTFSSVFFHYSTKLIVINLETSSNHCPPFLIDFYWFQFDYIEPKESLHNSHAGHSRVLWLPDVRAIRFAECKGLKINDRRVSVRSAGSTRNRRYYFRGEILFTTAPW